MKYLTLLIAITAFFFSASAQLSNSGLEELRQREDSMKAFALEIVQGKTPGDRLYADSVFTRMFVRALVTNYSFDYPFDSLITISRLTPPDSSFRIFTWQLYIHDNTVRHHGAIQMRTKDGSLKLFPLIDRSPEMQSPEDSIVSNLNWVGALYYKIIQKKAFKKNYYTLIGFDDHDMRSDKKVIEVLTFEDGKPVFGGNHFSFPDGNIKKKGVTRYIMTYKKGASPKLTYDPDLDMLVMEHLVSETGEPEKKYTYIPDGDYEGMKWKDGKWIYVTKIFTQITPEGQEPVPTPILDEKGKGKFDVKQNNNN
ncbi:MAG: hypothetical protein J5I50_11435 [Chitinophagaceae bacterium]|nr:hypothetical protein [Chitinophagaceae bacterium]